MRGPRLGVCLATSSTICITELKAHEKQGSRQEDYDKLTRLKTTESLKAHEKQGSRQEDYDKLTRLKTTESLKAHEKQGSRQEDYDKLTRLKTTESLRMRAYVLMYNQQLCAHGQEGYMQPLLLCESLWLATSAKWRTDLKVHMKSKEGRKIKIKLSRKNHH
jgi:cell fate (sporulation/competence/biofilm development) regulator YmcA (YheA/YmcA/DUF963 family)